jgi:hypothetical protein
VEIDATSGAVLSAQAEGAEKGAADKGGADKGGAQEGPETAD